MSGDKLKIFYKKITFVCLFLVSAVGFFYPTISVRAEILNRVDVWSDQYSAEQVGFAAFKEIGLGTRDPRRIIAAGINVLLGFAGVVAICFIIYGGWIWMNAKGNEAQVEKAKKLLKNAVIGLLIILSAFALSIYITRVLLGITDSTSAGVETGCQTGQSRSCGCNGLQVCSDGQWGTCVGSDCGGSTGQYCDGNTLTPTCDADNSNCGINEYCDSASCRCAKGGGLGSSCNGDTSTSTAACQPDQTKCGQYLKCDSTSCTCVGGPVIESVTPQGGYCDGSLSTPCLADDDCKTFNPVTCNRKNPNIATGNLVTVRGRYFGNYDAAKSKVLLPSTAGFVEANLADTVNPDCSGGWTDTQIIVVAPGNIKDGAVKVESINGEDISNDSVGPQLADAKVNELERPGLCKLSKEKGIFGDKIDYYGLNLQNSTGFFGNFFQSYQGDQSIFHDKLRGSVTVPNIESRDTTTYVLKTNKAASNFLDFSKLADAMSGPAINNFEPKDGPAGQYVTIRGTGFGIKKNDSKVIFGDVEADYSFPAFCAESVWSDNEIVVKVPKGLTDNNYKLTVIVGSDRAESLDNFVYDSSKDLAPGLCKLEPNLATGNDDINLYGEYFGRLDDYSKIIFQNNLEHQRTNKICIGGVDSGKNCNSDTDCDSSKCQSEISFWATDTKATTKIERATTKIPTEAITGPVRLSKNQTGLLSNSLNLTIGQCSKDEQCGNSNICCQVGSPLAGTCQSNKEKCFGTNDNCVFEWGFGTGSAGKCPEDRPNSCQDGTCCKAICAYDKNLGKTTCMDGESCGGYGAGQCLDANTCPNSPGKCSFSAAGEKIQGSSCDCAILGYVGAQYDVNLNKCVKPSYNCSLNMKVDDVDGNQVDAYCADYAGQPRWHIDSNKTCPDGFTKAAGNNSLCVDVNSFCQLCNSNYKCIDQGGLGICASPYPVCPSQFTCQAGSCAQEKKGSCECCCDKKQNKTDGTNPACCAPLTCDNECGAGGDFGSCSGCANVGSTQDEHDAACNCTGSSGKFCDTSVAGGVCRDCSQIGDSTKCTSHNSCCVDFKKGNACTGVKETKVFENNIGFCAYFDCNDNCQVAGKDKKYSNVENCQGSCAVSCDGSGSAGCQKDLNLCPADKPVCGNDCLCKESGEKPGDPCSSSKDGQCSLFCGNIYACRGSLGCTGLDCNGQPDEKTCRCCCNPHNQSNDPNSADYDKCKAVGKGNLSCQANAGDCTGNERGLCCGCSGDDECGLPNEVGCGKDRCCHPRPVVEQMVPASNADNVCRNPLIRADFSQQMDKGSFLTNMILVGDFLDETCPEGTSLLATADTSSNWFMNVVKTIKDWLAALVGLDNEAVAASGHNYCLVNGGIAVSDFQDANKNKTNAYYQIRSALNPGIKYYVIIKGDPQLNSQNGIKSINRIGFKGENLTTETSFNGLEFPNAQIWSFTTGYDICTITNVEVSPSQHLFQKKDEKYSFFAVAKTDNNQAIVSTNEYAWNWEWSVDNSSIATLSADETIPEMANGTPAKSNNGQTFGYAKAYITADTVSPISTAGQFYEGQTLLIVFLCNNPWPPVNNVNTWPIKWVDSSNNCKICYDKNTGKTKNCTPADCLNNDFSIYYCRDKATDKTKDDLPSIDKNSPINGYYLYVENSKWKEVIKSYYFFRDKLPEVPTGIKSENSDNKLGGSAKISWNISAGKKYKIYYGTSSKGYSASVEALKSPTIITGLKNNQTYYFAVTYIDDNANESSYSNESKLLVGDVVPPLSPAEFSGLITKKQANGLIDLTWRQEKIDVVKYIIEYGPSVMPAVSVDLGLKNNFKLDKLTNLNTSDYYFKLYAVDAFGNKSAAANLKCAKACAQAKCVCQ